MRYTTDLVAIGEFLGRLLAFADRLRDDRARLEIALIELEDDWTGVEDVFRPGFDETLATLRESNEVLETLGQRLTAVLEHFNARRGAIRPTSSAGSAPRASMAVRNAEADVPIVLHARGGRPLHTLTVATLTTAHFDWGDADFEQQFDSGKHHDHVAADYLALAARLPEVLRAIRESNGSPVFEQLSPEQFCYDAFFGTDPIAVERHGGVWDVKDGRHRLMACLRLSIDVPVLVIGGTK